MSPAPTATAGAAAAGAGAVEPSRDPTHPPPSLPQFTTHASPPPPADLTDAGHRIPTQMLALMNLLEKEGPAFSDRLLVTIRGAPRGCLKLPLLLPPPLVQVAAAGVHGAEAAAVRCALLLKVRRGFVAGRLPACQHRCLPAATAPQAWRTGGWCTKQRAAPPPSWTPSETCSCAPRTGRPRCGAGEAAAGGAAIVGAPSGAAPSSGLAGRGGEGIHEGPVPAAFVARPLDEAAAQAACPPAVRHPHLPHARRWCTAWQCSTRTARSQTSSARQVGSVCVRGTAAAAAPASG